MLVGCAIRATIRPEDEIYPHSKVSISFAIPAGWRLSSEEHQAEFKAALVPTNGDRAVITLLSSRNTWEKQTEEANSQEYLQYLRGSHDPRTSLQLVGSFDAGRFGRRNVYHTCTDYNAFVNDWLAVFLTRGPDAVQIEAWTPTCGDTTKYRQTLETIARSVSIENI
jgi:hypothetical protein